MTTMQRPTLELQGLTNAQCISLWFRTLDAYRDDVNEFDPALIGQVDDRITTPREALARFKSHVCGTVDVAATSGFKRPSSLEYPVLAQKVCDVFRVRYDQLGDSGRHKRVVAARMFIVHLMREHTKYSYPEIARMMGRPNHSTVITAHQRLHKAKDDGSKFEVWNDGTNRFEFWPVWEILERLEK